MWKWLVAALVFVTPTVAAKWYVAPSGSGTECAQSSPCWYVAPSGSGTECAQSSPCAPQDAVEKCYETNNPRRGCTIFFADGLYQLSGQIGVNLYFHYIVNLRGNCDDPSAVELQQETDGGAVIYVQDFQIAGISCLKVSAEANNVVGIAGRQHVIIDLDRITFGAMATHISLTEFAKASCAGTMTITGGDVTHASVSMNSQYNLLCRYALSGAPEFSYFVSAADFSVVDASLFSFTGSADGAKCHQVRSVIHGADRLPGSVDC